MKRTGVIVAMAALALLCGCKEKDKYVLVANHALHVVDNEMACGDCHGEGKNGVFARPNHKVCNECHDDIVQAKTISAKTCGVCHKQKDLSSITNRPPARAVAGGVERRVFVHTEALKDRCKACHGATIAEKSGVQPMKRRDVIALRDAAHAGDRQCTDCHVGMDPNVAPPSHDAGWTRVHGVRATMDRALCATCHHEETCRECHQSTKPASHNTLWSSKTHGIMASFDRGKCQVCHEEDFCAACHAVTRPRSHVGGWRDMHCLQCHASEADGTGCSTCHEASLDAHPNPHPAGWRAAHCSTCHRGTAEYQRCLLCHPGGVDEHPNPHRGGWVSQHCITCHPDSAETRSCRNCHPEGISGHPNPHSAGWRRDHCAICHFDKARRRDECVLCHEGAASSIQPHESAWPSQHSLFVTEQTDCLLCH